MNWYKFLDVVDKLKHLSEKGWVVTVGSDELKISHELYGDIAFNDYAQIMNFLNKWCDS